jgi:hypothetical protein
MINPFDRIAELETALRNIRATIVADTVAITDTVWMKEDILKGATVVDYIDGLVGVAKEPPKTLEELLNLAVGNCDFTVIAYYETPIETDYNGRDVEKALEAIRECDEMNVILQDTTGATRAWLYIVQQGPDMDPEEEISDCSGAWLEEIGYVSF